MWHARRTKPLEPAQHLVAPRGGESEEVRLPRDERTHPPRRGDASLEQPLHAALDLRGRRVEQPRRPHDERSKLILTCGYTAVTWRLRGGYVAVTGRLRGGDERSELILTEAELEEEREAVTRRLHGGYISSPKPSSRRSARRGSLRTHES